MRTRSHLSRPRPLLHLEALEERCLLNTQPAGALSGKIVYTHAGHGYTNNNLTDRRWTYQRGVTFDMIEDLGNHDQMSLYVDYLFNAGATVVPLRPVGHQPNEVVLDNVSPGVTFAGAWSNSTSTIYYGAAGAVPYRYANVAATETAVARYRPTIPQAGFYPVYAWARDGSDRVADQLYRVHHTGGATEVRVNHRRVGKGWVYLGTYYLDAGAGAAVEISNQSAGPSGVVIADAIRFGNGMGDIDRGGGVSRRPREDEAGLYWIERMRGQGVATSVYSSSGEDRTATVGASPRFAAHMNREADGSLGDRVFLSFHSNAFNGTGRGTVGLYNGNNNPATRTPNQLAWAQLVGREVNDDLVAVGSPPLEYAWFNRSVVTLDRSDIEFGEINNVYIRNEFDATIVEVAYHDNALDAPLMRDPKARDWVARATYQATVRYFNRFGGASLDFAPDPVPRAYAFADAAGNVTVAWEPPAPDAVGGAAPTGYVVQASYDGYGFDDAAYVDGGDSTWTVFSGLSGGAAYYFRVVAVNAGGHARPSPVVAARPPAGGAPTVLIVTGFDRFDRTLNPRETQLGRAVERVRPRESNSFDYAVQVGKALEGYWPDLGIDTVANEAISNGWVDLANYAAVVWVLGEESSRDRTFDPAEQAAVANYLAAGGNLFVSGSEIAWDLDALNNGRSFYRNVLRAAYAADGGGGYTAAGSAGGIFAGLSLRFDNGAQFYDVNSPDRITAQNGAVVAMSYTSPGSGGAAVQFVGGSPQYHVVMLGFPFETILGEGVRAAVMAAVLNFFFFTGPSGGDSGAGLAWAVLAGWPRPSVLPAAGELPKAGVGPGCAERDDDTTGHPAVLADAPVQPRQQLPAGRRALARQEIAPLPAECFDEEVQAATRIAGE